MNSAVNNREMDQEEPGALPILVVDDDRVTRELLRNLLGKEGFEVGLAESAEQAIRLLSSGEFPLILSDIQMMSMDGLGLLRHLRGIDSSAVVILMTAFGSLDGAIEAIRQGAFDYISKPIQQDELRNLLRRAFTHWRARHSGKFVPPYSLVSGHDERSLIGKSPRMVTVYKMVAKASMSLSNVLIVGESGTGKELVARAIHENSTRSRKPFITVNCGALAENLLESELFGHMKGSFTGAIATKKGLFAEADGGTIFLDEIGDISLPLQVKLLRVIQEGEFKPVGANESRRVDTRVITATHRDLEDQVKRGGFREDLYYRLKVISIDLPSLRDRMEDLGLLVDHFVSKFSAQSGKKVFQLSEEALKCLHAYSWPGNIRELEHAIERAVAMTNTTVLYPEDLPQSVVQSIDEGSVFEVRDHGVRELSPGSLEEMEYQHICRVLQEVHFNKSRAAHVLGIDRATLYRKASRYRIRLVEERMGSKPRRQNLSRAGS